MKAKLIEQINLFQPKFKNTKYVVLIKNQKKEKSFFEKINNESNLTKSNSINIHNKNGHSMEINISYFGDLKNKFGVFKEKLSKFEADKNYYNLLKNNINEIDHMKFCNEKLKELKFLMKKSLINENNEYFDDYSKLAFTSTDKRTKLYKSGNNNINNTENKKLNLIKDKELPSIKSYSFKKVIKYTNEDSENTKINKTNFTRKNYDINKNNKNIVVSMYSNREEKIKGLLEVKKINLLNLKENLICKNKIKNKIKIKKTETIFTIQPRKKIYKKKEQIINNYPKPTKVNEYTLTDSYLTCQKNNKLKKIISNNF